MFSFPSPSLFPKELTTLSTNLLLEKLSSLKPVLKVSRTKEGGDGLIFVGFLVCLVFLIAKVK